jgi:hypothetical protein
MATAAIPIVFALASRRKKIRRHPHSGSWGNGAASEMGGKAAYAGIDAAGTRRAPSFDARDHFEVAGRHGSARGLQPWLLGIWA